MSHQASDFLGNTVYTDYLLFWTTFLEVHVKRNNFKSLKIMAFVALTVPLWTACAQTSASDTSGGSSGGSSPTPVEVRLEPVVMGLEQPLGIVNAGDGSGRLFVLEKGGKVRILQDGELAAEPFLDISDKVTTNSERGLLGLAFAPNYADTGLFYVDYTDLNGDTVVAEYRVSADPAKADAGSEVILLTIPQPESNHNGGHLAFGPDGDLYIGTGDGGGAGDRHGAIGNGQNLDTLLGKLLRIEVGTEVGAGSSYAVPTDNPFVGTDGARPEIWAYGLRNPWRFSFDTQTGDLYIGDVGQNAYEEVDFQAADSGGGQNYGWRVMEGFHCFDPKNNCDETGLTLPGIEYPHSEGNSVTGGYVYRGDALPDLVGWYVYGDFGSGRVWRAQKQGDTWTNELLLESGLNIASFGEDEAGELYVVAIDGGVYRLMQ